MHRFFLLSIEITRKTLYLIELNKNYSYVVKKLIVFVKPKIVERFSSFY